MTYSDGYKHMFWNKQTNKQTNVTHIHGPVAAVNAHTLKASGSVTQLESQLL